ncbi:ABC transporter substrate-binding protein [Reichenbachiella agarivorans]|uniref:ABC transporter substrate-binding protein n=1 Tax=Reichenbachiella agarivorans TaxID=2979464 RepID=A0ABY6CNP6_9BACT|nr:ABC transporter substrate-binding protein [Reichenbachiella agarivorans]UXP32147.1 ABC transporter substrate-binding protein [Reichenbachiella agarivorans]
MKNLVPFLIVFGFWACQPNETHTTTSEPNVGIVQYAERFSIESMEGYRIITVNQPWQGNEDALTYMIYDDSIPEGEAYHHFIPIKYPVNSLVSNSTTHLSFLEILGVEEKLKGFAQTQYIYSSKINQLLDAQHMVEIGSEGKIDVEQVLNLKADIVLAFVARGENRQLEKLQELGQTIVLTPDYMENTVLGRAEWIKFVGYLTGKEKESEAYFDQVVLAYDSLLAMVTEVNRPTVYSGTLYGGTWFMPAGNNYNGMMINDAGGNYLWSDDQGNGWLNLDFEAVYAKAHDADFWIGAANYESLADIVAADERYADFKAFKTGQVYTYTKRSTANGGNDYFESGNANPHLLLADHIKILHPELLPDYELYYYKKLE